MRLTDWNASLAHAAELVDKLNQNGCNARAISYSITLSQAADELHRAGWSNYIDEDTARRLLKL